MDFIRVNGIFAISIFDLEQQSLYLPAMVKCKALYYIELDSGFLFASELKVNTEKLITKFKS